MRLHVFAGILALFAAQTLFAGRTPLKRHARFQSELINESSGIVKSRQHEGVYWTHNDSGDSARIFPVSRDGKSILPDSQEGEFTGIAVGRSVNNDWEDIATDDAGNLYIADSGNNGNARRDLAIYVVPEPNPHEQSQTAATKTIPFAFPDQRDFPPKDWNFDCEAIFWADGTLYALTKHRADSFTKLYRFDSYHSDQVNQLNLIGTCDVGGSVTAADASPDGRFLAVLTYGDIWIFEMPTGGDNYLSQPRRRLSLKAKQCEAICWIDPQNLLVTNEQQDLFQVALSQIPPISSPSPAAPDDT